MDNQTATIDTDDNIARIELCLGQLFEPQHVVELRCLGNGASKSGFFDDYTALAAHAVAAQQEGYACYFGLAPEFLREHLESQFTPEMNWENAGKVWHIDHIFPVAATNAKDPVEISVINNWKNLQPMMGTENIRKNDKVFPEARKLFNKLKKEFSKKQAG